jgi:asparagine synthase (glutamine-hydrolysing)
MCGIAGYLSFSEPPQAERLRKMCDAIRHRGPDDYGAYTDDACTIGMRRLSIIDLSTGHQPICNEDESMWIVFNGEIYNFPQLRADLEARGHRFRTRSDTEAILHLYEEYGLEALSRLRGMFVFAIWDKKRSEMLLARDRFGKKPLYLTRNAGGLYFGSEIKSLRAAGLHFHRDEEALRWYFLLNHIPDPLSGYREVTKLPAGGWLRIGRDGRQTEGLYWKPPVPAETPPPGLSRAQAEQELRERFDDCVQSRLLADVPLGAFLSGGVDSTLVVATMARLTREPVRTFSIGFAESGYDETPQARESAVFYGTSHHEQIVTPDSIALTEKLVESFDEPFADSSAIPTYLVSELASRHVKVVLSGDGGDELFAGYTVFPTIVSRAWADQVPQWIRHTVSAAAALLPYSTYGRNYLRAMSRETSFARYLESNYSPYFFRKRLFEPAWLPPADAAALARMFAASLPAQPAGPLAEAMYFEATAKLTGDILTKVDRTSMANSLEVRCPLLDHTLAEFAATLPHGWKLANGRGKQILISALGDRLPPGLLSRPKKGFSVPLRKWFRGPLNGYLRDHLTSGSSRLQGIVSQPFLQQILTEHESGRRDNSTWLWALLMAELWFRRFEQDPSAA